jgi:hypothetical protein
LLSKKKAKQFVEGEKYLKIKITEDGERPSNQQLISGAKDFCGLKTKGKQIDHWTFPARSAWTDRSCSIVKAEFRGNCAIRIRKENSFVIDNRFSS